MRKYVKAEYITSIVELMEQDFVFWYDKVYHKDWFKWWQIEWAIGQIGNKTIRKAVHI